MTWLLLQGERSPSPAPFKLVTSLCGRWDALEGTALQHFHGLGPLVCMERERSCGKNSLVGRGETWSPQPFMGCFLLKGGVLPQYGMFCLISKITGAQPLLTPTESPLHGRKLQCPSSYQHVGCCEGDKEKGERTRRSCETEGRGKLSGHLRQLEYHLHKKQRER